MTRTGSKLGWHTLKLPVVSHGMATYLSTVLYFGTRSTAKSQGATKRPSHFGNIINFLHRDIPKVSLRRPGAVNKLYIHVVGLYSSYMSVPLITIRTSRYRTLPVEGVKSATSAQYNIDNSANKK